MTQDEKLDYLIDFFKKDSRDYKNMEVAKSDRRSVLRSLMNIRMPNSVPGNVLKIQDVYLQEEAREKGIVSLDEISTVREEFKSNSEYADKISIWQGILLD